MTLRQPYTGKLGENCLDTYCAEQRIMCTPPSDDIMGWDRMLCWLDADEDGAWDKRKEGFRAFIQVKEDHSGNGKVKINPSTFRELVLAEDPAFILIVEIQDGRVHGTSLLHVWKRECTAVLSRLRQKDTGNFKLGTKRNAVAVADSAAFLEELQRIVGSSMADYRANKRQMLDALGYPDARYHFSFELKDTYTELVEFGIGLRPRLAIRRSAIFEKRFESAQPLEA